jgi:hypothetical protein
MKLWLDKLRGTLYDRPKLGRPVAFRDLLPLFEGDAGPCSVVIGEVRGGTFYSAEFDPDEIAVYISRQRPEILKDWRLTYYGQTTDWIPATANRHIVSATINALSTIQAAGGVVVYERGKLGYLLLWKTSGADPTVTVSGRTAEDLIEATVTESTTSAYPSALINFYEDTLAQVDGLQVRETSLIKEAITSGPYYQDLLYFDCEPQDGFFALAHGGNTTPPISVFASAQQVQDALESISPGIFRVRKHGEYAWQLNRITSDTGSVTVHQDGVISYDELAGVWNLTDRGLALLQTDDPLECQITIAHDNRILYRDTAMIVPNNLATTAGEGPGTAEVTTETVSVELLAADTQATVAVPSGYEVSHLFDLRLLVSGAGVTGEVGINDYYESGGDIVVRLRGQVDANDQYTLQAVFLKPLEA